MEKYELFRKQYPTFIYKSYEIEETEDAVNLRFCFETVGLSEYTPTWCLPKKAGAMQNLKEDAVFKKLVFSLGMTELVSYWKMTCSPKVCVACGSLSEAQKQWWKELYYHGLGEFFYTNGIVANPKDFMEIESVEEGASFGQTANEAMKQPCMSEKVKQPCMKERSGCLIPIGGGKDSAVSVELMRLAGERSMCYIINPRGATVYTTQVGGFSWEEVLDAKRTLDKRMLDLNAKGFLNGHTPYSAIVAFSSVMAAYIHGLRYVVLSNEASANESTVMGSTVNHQYSKSFKFEKDFHDYEAAYIGSGVAYFSLLRPLSEFQIAKFFAKCKAYHGIFRSCNVGSKEDRWCGHCSKCLFVFVILSPFLHHEELVSIFGRDMLADEEMLPILDQLTGAVDVKPFECVGSRDEINTALCLTIRQMDEAKETLPILLETYKNSPLYDRYDGMGDTFSDGFNEENLLPEAFASLVRENCCRK